MIDVYEIFRLTSMKICDITTQLSGANSHLLEFVTALNLEFQNLELLLLPKIIF